MADTKISALTAASAALAANELPINDAGASKKLTAQQIVDLVVALRLGLVVATSMGMNLQ